MLQLIINGKKAILPPDVSLGVQLKNTLIVDREEDATYPFTLPIYANRHIFKFPDLINNNDFVRKYTGCVVFGPYQILFGEVIVTDVSDTEIELYVSTNNRTFWGKYGSKFLDEFDIGSEAWSYDIFNASLRTYKPYVCTQLYDPSFSAAGYIPEFYNRWKMVDVCLQKTQNGIKNNICPFMRLTEVVKLIFSAAGYVILYNAMDDVAGFKDIIIVFRHTFNEPATFSYNEVLPHITIREFLDECKRKFGFAFFINEANKTVVIRSSSVLRSEQTIGLEILNGLQKTIDSDAEGKVYKFTDKSVTDQFLNTYTNDLSYITGDENSENIESVECISTIVGVQEKLEHFFSGETDSSGEEVFLNVRYDLLSTTSLFENTEFRLACYNGLVNGIQNSGSAGIPTGKFLVPFANPGSLLWPILYNKFHKSFCETDKSITIDLDLRSNVLMLVNLQAMFVNNVICRNQRFVVKEQEIEFLADRISSHKVTVIPI